MNKRDNYWLSRACRDHRLPPTAFRIAYSVMKMSARGKLRATTSQLLHFAGAPSSPTLLHSLDRLGSLGYLRYDRECRGGPLVIDIIYTE